jgi:hypothetical protein
MRKHFPRWTLVDWDGNPELGLKCWRKSFGRGKVSIGCGEFDLIVYSFGRDSDMSYSSTRMRSGILMSEQDAMKMVDREMGRR